MVGTAPGPLVSLALCAFGASSISNSLERQEVVFFLCHERVSKRSGSLDRSQRKGRGRLPLEFSLHCTLCHCAGCPHVLPRPPVLGPWPRNARSLPGDRPPPRWECLVPVTPFPGSPHRPLAAAWGQRPSPPTSLEITGDPCSLCVAAPRASPVSSSLLQVLFLHENLHLRA